MLHLLKEKINNGNVYILQFDKNHSVFFTAIPLNEYLSVKDFLALYPYSILDVEEQVFKSCLVQYADIETGVVYIRDNNAGDLFDLPTLMEIIPAGIVSSTFNAIMTVSGPSEAQELNIELNIARQYTQIDILETILSLLSSVYKQDIDDIKKKEWSEILRMYSQAELLLMGQMPQLPLEVKIDDKQA